MNYGDFQKVSPESRILRTSTASYIRGEEKIFFTQIQCVNKLDSIPRLQLRSRKQSVSDERNITN